MATSPHPQGAPVAIPGPRSIAIPTPSGGPARPSPVDGAKASPTTKAQAAPSLDMATIRAGCLSGLHELTALQNRRQHHNGSASAYELECLISGQSQLLLGNLRTLQSSVRHLARVAESQRWRRWLFGGALAALIPAVRTIFRTGSDRHSSANDTEHAFRKSEGLVARIRHGVLGNGMLARVALFVLGVLVVFQNEVLLRVAKTVHRRLKRLCERMERGESDVADDADMAVLDGWRWRVLL
ncbi:hypothetical protein XA68_17320 [Ophiocordyceps unilateralis]|uniref:Uncharacterized protein n=1 Tax=Ophiocordyceps unilateralis TaxID=268505 RepID=A0A2A9P512_OPHUN|nr:hypothetical protein XA68_17320 [Ophiocordyceps unilateralis]